MKIVEPSVMRRLRKSRTSPRGAELGAPNNKFRTAGYVTPKRVRLPLKLL